MNQHKFEQSRRLIKLIKYEGITEREDKRREYFSVNFGDGDSVPITMVTIANRGTYLECKCKHCSSHIRDYKLVNPPDSPFLCMCKIALILYLAKVRG